MLFACAVSPLAQAEHVLAAVKARGVLNCGVSGGAPGFSTVDADGNWRGLDTDVCRAVAAAVLGDPARVRFTATTSQNRFAVLQAGEVDMLSRITSWTLSRDTALGLQFAGVVYYDGQGIMIPVRLQRRSALQLDGVHVCVTAGSTSEKNLANYFRQHRLRYTPVVFDNVAAAVKAYSTGRCQAYTSDVSDLSGIRAKMPDPDAHQILPEVLSKEPLGPLVRRGDDEWFAIVKWVLFALVAAEEAGVTRANVTAMTAGAADPQLRHMLGDARLPGVDGPWVARVVGAVGNYGEVFGRNLGAGSALRLPRGLNAQWRDGGLMYAPPID
ncbi:amino acid ABC transporter substrate-binding protein [Pseudoduganella sp. UC29_106]|uniref:amino acid ABC transporter substrate-binding protein n=1 Tax=Pseudoduganella sp. UC29_106 TaxID=3374553 RepID=UPI0037583F26